MRLPMGPRARFRAMAGLWIYDSFKLVLAYPFMKHYGINPWIFFFLDVLTVPLYIIGWYRLIQTLTGAIQPFRTIFYWGLITFIASTGPYIYAAWAGQKAFPKQVWGVLILLTVFPVFNLIRKARACKKPPLGEGNPSPCGKAGQKKAV